MDSENYNKSAKHRKLVGDGFGGSFPDPCDTIFGRYDDVDDYNCNDGDWFIGLSFNSEECMRQVCKVKGYKIKTDTNRKQSVDKKTER